LISLGFFAGLSDFSYLPEITLPYRRRLENSLLPLEVTGWIPRNHFGKLPVWSLEVENYQLNYSVLAG